MQTTKPYLFIGSSQEAIDEKIVAKFATGLESEAVSISWKDVPEFKEGGAKSTFEALLTAANGYDFALFVLTPDDEVKSRGREFKAARDNLWFELGLFVAAIGPERVFLSAQSVADGTFRTPSDLLGINSPRFHFRGKDAGETTSSIRNVCEDFALQIRKLRFRRMYLQLVSQWGYSWEKGQFHISLSAAKITRNRSLIDHWRVVIAVRVVSPDFDFERDPHVIYSMPRQFSDVVDDDIRFTFTKAELTEKGREIKENTELQAHVVLVPPELDFKNPALLNDAIECRCRDVEKTWFEVGQPPSVS